MSSLISLSLSIFICKVGSLYLAYWAIAKSEVYSQGGEKLSSVSSYGVTGEGAVGQHLEGRWRVKECGHPVVMLTVGSTAPGQEQCLTDDGEDGDCGIHFLTFLPGW